jgi:hypothetical protein
MSKEFARLSRVKSWNANKGSVLLLCGMLAIILAILVLPDVDLPYVAFQLSTAPAVVHAQVNAPQFLQKFVASHGFLDRLPIYSPSEMKMERAVKSEGRLITDSAYTLRC